MAFIKAAAATAVVAAPGESLPIPLTKYDGAEPGDLTGPKPQPAVPLLEASPVYMGEAVSEGGKHKKWIISVTHAANCLRHQDLIAAGIVEKKPLWTEHRAHLSTYSKTKMLQRKVLFQLHECTLQDATASKVNSFITGRTNGQYTVIVHEQVLPMLEVYGLCTFSKFVAEMQQPLNVDKVDLEVQPFALPGTDLRKAIADGDELRHKFANAIDVDACTPPRHKRNRSAWQTINELTALGVQRDEVAKRKKAKSNDNDIMYLDREPDDTPSSSTQESVIE